MKSLFESATLEEVKQRLARLRSDSPRQWGRMNAAQAAAHCSASLELALGDKYAPPMFFPARFIGRVIKPFVLADGKPMRRNSPTMKALVMLDQRDLEAERARLNGMLERFTASGPAGCTNNPHSFFGRLTPDEWAVLMYKHLDHHLRQFGV